MSEFARVPLGDLAVFINGDRGTNYPSKSDFVVKGIPFINAGHLVGGRVDFAGMNYITVDRFNKLGSGKTKVHDILYCLRGSLGKTAIVCHDGDAAIASSLVIIRPREDTSVGYLYRYLTSPLGVAEIRRFDNGSSQPNLSAASVKKYQVPLPSLAEQKRIAEILDAADALRVKRRESLAQLDTLLQSTFLDMFGDPVTNPKAWDVAELGSHTSKVGSGATPKGGNDSYKAEGIALIRSLNVRDGEFRWKNLARIDDEQAGKLSNVVVEESDVLLNITGASVARVCRAPGDVIPARVNQHVCIIRTASSIEPPFLEKLLLAGSMKSKLLGMGESGATRQAITKAQVLALEVPIPPIEYQQRFSAFVEAVEQQRAHQLAYLAELDTLFASLQQRAFSGELSK